jgi:hypothetical protein
MTSNHDEQELRATLCEIVGRVVDVVDVLRAIATSSRLAAEKLDKVGAALTRIAVQVGEAEED